MTDKIRVVTVDDSGLMQKLLKAALSDCPQIEIVGQAMDAAEARNMIKQYNPDIITLDVEMPGMNGLEFLERLMNARPMPVIMFSSHTSEGTEITIKALELGAVDFLQKPRVGLDKSIEYLSNELIPKILSFGKSKPRTMRDTMISMQQSESAGHNLSDKQRRISNSSVNFDLIAIGASTGGVNAIRELLGTLPNNLPPIVITQHMPEGFTSRFAERLNRDCAMRVVEASNHQTLEDGCVYIAPGTHHLKIMKRGTKYVTELSDGATVSGHRPSVDVMFQSIAKTIDGGHCVAIMLTGMGRDGANGMLELKQLGCPTIGQCKDSCVVYGMPKVAKEIGAVNVELPLDKISHELLNILCDTNAQNVPKRKAV